MSDLQKIETLLSEINERQDKALELQQQIADLTRRRFEITEKQVNESIELQKVAVARQSRLVKFLFPVIVVLLLTFVYLAFS